MRPLSLLQIAVLMLLSTLGMAHAQNHAEYWKRQGWKTDFSKSLIDFAEILSGGPPRDGIPSIDDPRFIPVAEEKDVEAREPVIFLEIAGDARAYPLRILTWHEIVNDVVGDMPVAVTYCPLCNTSVVFDRQVNGQVLEFGTTGKLRNSDLVMYDRQTESWWQQFTGEAIIGELVGEELDMVPSRVTSLAAFRENHPDGKILVPNDRSARDYGRNPYVGYEGAAAPFLYRGDLPDGIPAMARVVVVRTGGEPLIVTLDKIRREGHSERGYEFVWTEGMASALDTAEIARGKDVGAVRVTKDGKDVVHDVTFAFVAHAFHPEADIAGR